MRQNDACPTPSNAIRQASDSAGKDKNVPLSALGVDAAHGQCRLSGSCKKAEGQRSAGGMPVRSTYSFPTRTGGWLGMLFFSPFAV